MCQFGSDVFFFNLFNKYFSGTRKMYSFIRRDVGITFYDGSHALDTSLQSLLAAIKQRSIDNLIVDIFGHCDDGNTL